MRIFLLTLLLTLPVATLTAGSQRHALIFTATRIEAARQHIKTDTAYATAWGVLRHRADAATLRPTAERGDVLALAWLVTGEQKYRDALHTLLTATTRDKGPWVSPDMLERSPAWRSDLTTAHRAFALALAYDALRPTLSAKERHDIGSALWRLAAEPLLGDWIMPATRIHSLNSMGHNWWASCVGMGGVLALALRDDVPGALAATEQLDEAFAEWYAFPGDTLGPKPATFGDEGGTYEGINYAYYGLQEALLYRLAEHNAHLGVGTQHGASARSITEFFLHTCYPHSHGLWSINFGDSHLATVGDNCLILLAALGYNSPEAQWYIAHTTPHQHREQYALDTPIGFLYRPLPSHTATPTLPTSHLFAAHGWATLRSSWADDATMLAVKSGLTWNHAHADAGSLLLFHRGQPIIAEAGRCWYANPKYRDYYFQSEAHNVVMLDGQGQPRSQQYYGSTLPGHVSSLVDDGEIRYVLADATGPNADRFSRYFRHFLWVGRVLLIIDDLATHRPGTFSWAWHPGLPTRRDGASLAIGTPKPLAWLTPLYPQPLAPTPFQQDYPTTLTADTISATGEDLKPAPPYWSLTLPGTYQRVKAVTAITLADDSHERPTIRRFEGKDYIGVSITDGKRETRLYINQLADGRLMHLNSWIDTGEWQTDAYLLLTQSDNNATQQPRFIAHGSIVRHNGQRPLFQSLAKQTATLPRKATQRGSLQ